VRAEYDPRVSPGIGGQVPVQNGLFITFVLSAWIRELGFRADVESQLEAKTLAAQAGLGRLDAEGRLVTPQFGTKVYIADAICTDLPLIADG
jgi:epoxyqueuosine reductase QueG